MYYPEIDMVVESGIGDGQIPIRHLWYSLESFLIEQKAILIPEEYERILEAVSLKRDRIRGETDWQIPYDFSTIMTPHYSNGNCPFHGDKDYEIDCKPADCRDCFNEKFKGKTTILPIEKDFKNKAVFDSLTAAMGHEMYESFHEIYAHKCAEKNWRQVSGLVNLSRGVFNCDQTSDCNNCPQLRGDASCPNDDDPLELED